MLNCSLPLLTFQLRAPTPFGLGSKWPLVGYLLSSAFPIFSNVFIMALRTLSFSFPKSVIISNLTSRPFIKAAKASFSLLGTNTFKFIVRLPVGRFFSSLMIFAESSTASLAQPSCEVGKYREIALVGNQIV